jgi:hypothetical protein
MPFGIVLDFEHLFHLYGSLEIAMNISSVKGGIEKDSAFNPLS